jgi:hypothetical protein
MATGNWLLLHTKAAKISLAVNTKFSRIPVHIFVFCTQTSVTKPYDHVIVGVV